MYTEDEIKTQRKLLQRLMKKEDLNIEELIELTGYESDICGCLGAQRGLSRRAAVRIAKVFSLDAGYLMPGWMTDEGAQKMVTEEDDDVEDDEDLNDSIAEAFAEQPRKNGTFHHPKLARVHRELDMLIDNEIEDIRHDIKLMQEILSSLGEPDEKETLVTHCWWDIVYLYNDGVGTLWYTDDHLDYKENEGIIGYGTQLVSAPSYILLKLYDKLYLIFAHAINLIHEATGSGLISIDRVEKGFDKRKRTAETWP